MTSARTEVSDTWAQPDGSFSVKRYGSPVRLFRNGDWVATDPSLAFAADGTVVPKASTVSVAFSGGGTGPLLSGVKDGRTLTLSWPTSLPKPVLAGNVATYGEVLPGVDLQLKAEVEGFSQLFVVKTAAAANNPQLATLTYKMKTVGLTVSADAETGSLAAVDPAGQTVFTSPTPLMWDSRTASSAPTARSATAAATDEPAPGDAFEPPPGAADAQMPTTVSADSIEIKPDQALLTGSGTTYPVYIDPTWAWGKKENWTRVYKKYPKSSFWNANEVARVGYENETNGLSRSFFQVDTDNIKGADVKSSTFRIKNVWSWSCQDRPVEIWQTKPISKKTTWNKQPEKVGSSPLKTVDQSKGWSKDCAAGNLEFDVTAKAREAAAGKWSSLTLGLYATNENDTFGWKKFDAKTAVLETRYNNPPKTPSGLGTNPKTSCSAGGLIGNTKVSLYATVDDPDAGNLTAQFQVFKSGSSTPVVDQKIDALKGRVATLPTTDALIPTGAYTWKVRAEDSQGATSAWSPTCKFSVDRTRPGTPPVISSVVFPDGTDGWPTTTGKARTPGAFTFSVGAADKVTEIGWYTDSDPAVRYISATTEGLSPSRDIAPPGYGPHFVYAFSVDGAGNRSDTGVYLYYATRSADRDAPGDLNGDGIKDIWSVDSNGTLLTYVGQEGGQFSNATNGGQAFDGAQTTYRTDWGNDGYTDLVTLEFDTAEKRRKLWTYTNNGFGLATTDYKEGKQPLTVKCPVVDEDYGCVGEPGWTGNDHWSDASQVLTPGDINGDSMPDLLVKEGTLLWAYYGNYTKRLSVPVLVGGNDWDKFTVVAPGDLNGDKLADLWMRNNATGDIYRAHGSADQYGVLDPTTWGNTAARVKIGSGYPAATYPVVDSVGDITGDGVSDLWARKADNTMVGFPGKVSGATFSFAASFTIDGAAGGTRIPAGTTIAPGKSYTSRSAKLTMKEDGNLEITSAANKPLWSTGTSGNVGAKAVMQPNGNLVVYKSDGSTVLWESKTSAAEGYALLQDRGNFAVYNAKGQSVWAAGTSIRQDVNGDGRSDMVEWHDYSDGNDAIHTFLTTSDGGFAAPAKAYTTPGNQWTLQWMKKVSGDFNGDGMSDVAVMYDYPDNSTKLWTFLGRSNGTFAYPFVSWTATQGRWDFARSTLFAGDFNGDGRDDIAAWYDYADGSDMLYTFTSNVQGGFNAPFHTWSAPNQWAVSRCKFVVGDFNGDGRDDISVFYNYDGSSVKLWNFTAQPSGGFDRPIEAWSHANWGSWDRTAVYSGDFDGDGRDDVATWYDYADGTDTIYVHRSRNTATGSFDTPTTAWTVPPGTLTFGSMKIVPADYNGDGRDDFGAMYGYSDGSVRMFTWLTKPDSTLETIKTSWVSPTPSYWSYPLSHFVYRSN
ncbi:FG-GAP-like repeat-containing protein [Streptomyces sp. NBC_01433]|uniref:FG-GAP-like repeat-containing protein n=1 Tax=Streptomyces sp. NBC_01433 TaxID=2903864 RepID=UPI00225143AE|nr:FG-GAP-like repeat-containing protein [Streptomyces sp. NBC_01433]MCX4674733.1 FG-GAP-like repeat-containing protein [Streptomyces sp. NBC_01433]